MKIIRNKYLPPKGFSAIMLFGFLFARYKTPISERTIRHEKIHRQQMIEMWVVFFYLWYGIEFLIRLCQYRNPKDAYRNISFEREAYAKDHLKTYKREPFAWVYYLTTPSNDSQNSQKKEN